MRAACSLSVHGGVYAAVGANGGLGVCVCAGVLGTQKNERERYCQSCQQRADSVERRQAFRRSGASAAAPSLLRRASEPRRHGSLAPSSPHRLLPCRPTQVGRLRLLDSEAEPSPARVRLQVPRPALRVACCHATVPVNHSRNILGARDCRHLPRCNATIPARSYFFFPSSVLSLTRSPTRSEVLRVLSICRGRASGRFPRMDTKGTCMVEHSVASSPASYHSLGRPVLYQSTHPQPAGDTCGSRVV